MAQNRQFPVREPLINPEDGTVSDRWRIYFRDQQQTIDTTPTLVVPPVTIDAHNASIGTTAIPTESLASGLYAVEFYAEVTTAAVTSSSFQLTIGFTSQGVSKSFSSTAMTGNTTATVSSQRWMMNIDEATPISYAVTYASNGAGQMIYNLSLVLTSVSA